MSVSENRSGRMESAETRRDVILRAVRRSRPPAAPLPDLPSPSQGGDDLTAAFSASVEAAGGHVRELNASKESGTDGAGRARESGVTEEALPVAVDAHALESTVKNLHPDAAIVASVRSADPEGIFDDLADHRSEHVDVLVCRGLLGVAENGAVWLHESAMGERGAPFLAQHLVLVLPSNCIVADMHAAYDRIRIDAEGFGLFVAGPSKTADIEQALVIGAHGPRSFTVLLTRRFNRPT